MTALQSDYQTDRRMALKRQAIPLPFFGGKRVLDVGCDFGAWSFLAADQGAAKVLGLDRNRDVRGRGQTNLIAINTEVAKHRQNAGVCEFKRIDLGKQWHNFGTFDVVLCFSMYHHWFENCGDHAPIWFWLWKHCAHDGVVLWENPVDDRDPVVQANVSDENRPLYRLGAIIGAAKEWFEAEFVGPALHEPTREVWTFRPLPAMPRYSSAIMLAGAGGATAAFEYADGRRIGEVESILGFRPVPGSLNLRLDGPFDWDRGYYRAQVLDVKDRSAGLDSEWAPRWARFYPLTIDGHSVCAFRFEGERYELRFMEVIAPQRLRDVIPGPRVVVAR